MRILYVAKHGHHDNEDEDAITFALRKLGHQVFCVDERLFRYEHQTNCDWLLFHKWPNAGRFLPNLSIPAVFWYFDKVDDDGDETLRERSRARVQWMNAVIPHVLCGFCTDGDWAAKAPNNLVWLTQGADERVVGAGNSESFGEQYDIAFFGMVNHGQRRANHISHLRERYGGRFNVIGDNVHQRVHGRAMADLIARTKVVIAPDGPNTDRYWSNRFYQVLGFGGFLAHPYCGKLSEQYTAGFDFIGYDSWEHCDEMIELALGKPNLRKMCAASGFARTVSHNLYRHRCAELVAEVQRRLGK